ncbi:gp21 prohead core and protease [Delftia phage PhiW-14]|uniref:Gp21 prohead core and protease n=1 Tax=Delftia phage PhiW-14 TaxID=665032 RepID=C9DG12_BPW14|nr:gp21 prohead core and protease [Delftia phage PhiW-14]ACV50063.1 gp21 prohead core and protease [Delftia phage PhiW-14]
MSNKLLVESVERVEVLNEQTKQGRKLFLEGNFIMTEKPNRNRRRYRKSLMEGVVDRYVQDYVQDRRAIGELNHPEYPFPDIKRAALLTKSLTWQGDNVAGKALVLEEMEDGRIIKCLLDAGFNLGVSTRGLGDVSTGYDGIDDVTEYELNAIDAVDRPSGQVCYVGALNESWVQAPTGIWSKTTIKEIVETAAPATPEAKRIDETALLNALDKYIERQKGAGTSHVSMFV